MSFIIKTCEYTYAKVNKSKTHLFISFIMMNR